MTTRRGWPSSPEGSRLLACVLLENGTRVDTDSDGTLPAGHAGARRKWPRYVPGTSVTSVSGPAVGRKLAINRLRERKPIEPAIVDRFLARNEIPIVEGARCTFLYRGDADEVRLIHRIFGLPERIPLRRLHGTDLLVRQWWSCPTAPELSTSWKWRAASSASASTTR